MEISQPDLHDLEPCFLLAQHPGHSLGGGPVLTIIRAHQAQCAYAWTLVGLTDSRLCASNESARFHKLFVPESSALCISSVGLRPLVPRTVY